MDITGPLLQGGNTEFVNTLPHATLCTKQVTCGGPFWQINSVVVSVAGIGNSIDNGEKTLNKNVKIETHRDI